MKYTRCRQCGYHLEPGAGRCFNCSTPANKALAVNIDALPVSDLTFNRFYNQINDRQKKQINRIGVALVMVLYLSGLALTVFTANHLAQMTLVLTGITLFAFHRKSPKFDKLYFLLYYPGFKKHWRQSLVRAELELNERIAAVEAKEERLETELKKLASEAGSAQRSRIVEGLRTGLLLLRETRGQYRIKLYEIYLTRLNNALHYHRDTLDQVRTPIQFESRIASVESLLTTCQRYQKEWGKDPTPVMQASRLEEVLARLEEQFQRLRNWLVDHRAIATLREVSPLDAPYPPPLFPEETVTSALGQVIDDHLIHSLDQFWKDYQKVDRELDRIDYEKRLLDRWK